MKNTSGFTLIELLTVIAVIGILAVVGLTTYSGIQRNARDARRKADVELIRSAVEQYRSNNNVYPTMIPYPGGTGLCDPGGCANGTYLQTVPSDPTTSQRYVYRYLSPSDYEVGSLLTNPGAGAACAGSNCMSSGTPVVCNYCIGPYGRK